MKLLNKGQVCEKLGHISDVTLWRLVRAERFPKPIQISPRRVGWPEHVVDAWIAEEQAKVEAA